MNTEEFIRQLDELKEHILKDDARSSAMNAEIHMWRIRYLESLIIEGNAEKGAHVWSGFLYAPSVSMMKTTPEKYINELRDFYENKSR